ncbi:MAG TPA: NAD(P)/FAD-dependent oxidoreductase [Burkholderiaceae bacterium]|nr:NAD(P)/FAD-dependent oxidoreductase [Burkholderiaceae bacterium]
MKSEPHQFDVVVIGAGAAGLFCAGVAGQLGLKVLVLDHSDKVAEKIRISGGGRANFTNKDASPANFLSSNPHFCRSALSRYKPQDFMALMNKHGVAYHEKHKGQLFCNHSANDLITVLLQECDAGGVKILSKCAISLINSCQDCYEINSNLGIFSCPQLVIATGGLSIPKIGASDFGYQIAQQFGLRVVETRPGLVPLTFEAADWAPWIDLAGLSLPVQIETGNKKSKISFTEDLLFTHRGLSGPAILQISSYWREKTPIRINLTPNADMLAFLMKIKSTSRKLLVNELSNVIPARLAEAWIKTDLALQRPACDVPDKSLSQLAHRLCNWEITPTGTEGYKKAEVTVGGIDTRDVSSQTMESKQPGLYFIGEVLDVTGWLGGYNFQWAWASGFACAQAMAQAPKKRV